MTTLPSPEETPDPPEPFPGSIPPPVPAEISAWLRANAIPFNTSQPGTDYSDLMPLKQIIGDARLVLLGEATHGTHEFFAMKHRLFEFLVKEMGFTVFGIEDTWAGAEAINDYVQGQPVHPGTSDRSPSDASPGTAEAAHNMLNYWTWHTSEVLDMIKWMRVYNDDPTNRSKITFTGFDMQDVDRPAEYVLNYLRKVDPSQVDTVASLYGCISGLGPEPVGYWDLPRERRTECRSQLKKVHTLLQERREEYEKRSDRREFAKALHAARIMLQAEHRYSPGARPQMRERYMVQNVAWLLENAGPGPNAKTVLWAHNMHVIKQILAGERPPWVSMGHYLHERFGHRAFSVGFTFGRGTFTAVTLRDGEFLGLERQEAGQPPADSYEHYLAGAGMPRMLLDLRSIKQGRAGTPGTAISPETDWLIGSRRLRSVGSAYDSCVSEPWFEKVSLPEAFDLLIYFQEAKASSLLPPP